MRHLTIIAALSFMPVIAMAHAHLQKADPAVGSTVKAPPGQVSIHFSEGVEPRFSSITVTGPGGAAVDKHDVHIAAGDQQELIVGVQPLPPGVYTVEWHATSIDTHKTEGKFTFTVAP
jgi:methionine-rich copper-binding protein CopC